MIEASVLLAHVRKENVLQNVQKLLIAAKLFVLDFGKTWFLLIYLSRCLDLETAK